MNEIVQILSDVQKYVSSMINSLQNGEDAAEIFLSKLNGLSQLLRKLQEILNPEVMNMHSDFWCKICEYCFLCQDVDFLVEHVDILFDQLNQLLVCLDSISIEYKEENDDDRYGDDDEIIFSDDFLKNGPLVSVILPCYNHEQFVAQAIESVINQTYKNIEFIVGDDGSTDNTPIIMQQYQSYYKEALYYKENTRCAIFDDLLDKCKGKYVALMHSDDVWAEDKIAKQVAYLEKHDECSVCLSWCKYTDDNLNVLDEKSIFIQPNRTREEWMRFFWFNGNALCNPSSLIRREDYQNCGQYGGAGRQIPDYFKWIDYVQKTEIYIYPEVLIYMRRYNHNESENTSAVTVDNMARHTIEEALGWFNVIRDMKSEFFIESFKNFFINKEARTEKEIKCEKFFLMRNSNKEFMQHNALIYFTEIQMEVMDTLITKYNYNMADFQRDELEKGLGGLVKKIYESREINN